MTPKEFKEKFKVGDYVNLPCSEPNSEIKITAIGQYRFLAEDRIAGELAADIDKNWIKVEPEKKPSTAIRERMKPFKYWQGVSTEPCIDYLEDKVNSMLVFLDDNWPNVVKK